MEKKNYIKPTLYAHKVEFRALLNPGSYGCPPPPPPYDRGPHPGLPPDDRFPRREFPREKEGPKESQRYLDNGPL